MPNLKFGLSKYQVPAPPKTNLWADQLRWALMVMDPDDKRLPFVSGCLSYALKEGGLTNKQCTVSEKILNKIRDDFYAEILLCQNTDDDSSKIEPIEVIEPKGSIH